MKPVLLAAAFAALALPLLSSCANASLVTEAEELRDQLAGMPGVDHVTLDYTEPVTLDSGKLELQVRMTAEATSASVIDVVTTTYDAFADIHHGEEGDLDVVVGDDVIHLRSFEPDAKLDGVEKAVSHAVAVLPSGSVRVDINTQDMDNAPHVFTSYAVAVDEPGAGSVLATLADLEAVHGDIPDASWSVQSGGEFGWLLSADKGFPGPEQTALFDDLREGLPEGAVILLSGDFATVQLPQDTSADATSAMVDRHLTLLGGPGQAFYHVEIGDGLLVAITHGECYFDTGEVGVRLERDHKAGCQNIMHPE